MARPRSDDKRSAILSAAIRIIASQGLGAPTAMIAKEASVSNGSLFTYFETKTELLNRIYVELKSEMAATALDELPIKEETREQMLHMWSRWLRWSISFPEKRRALAHLDVSDEITPASRQAARQAMSGIAKLLENGRAQGAMRDAPLGLVVGLITALANAAVDFIIADQANADQHTQATFNALWRMIG